MKSLHWIGGLAATLAIAFVASTGTARAQDSSGELVYTMCKQGLIEVCGEQVIATECSSRWSANFGLVARAIGFDWGGSNNCAGTTKMNLYKNYKRGETEYGVCFDVQLQKQETTTSPPGDADYDEPSSEC